MFVTFNTFSIFLEKLIIIFYDLYHKYKLFLAFILFFGYFDIFMEKIILHDDIDDHEKKNSLKNMIFCLKKKLYYSY
jgi:hypothetical protein